MCTCSRQLFLIQHICMLHFQACHRMFCRFLLEMAQHKIRGVVLVFVIRGRRVMAKRGAHWAAAHFAGCLHTQLAAPVRCFVRSARRGHFGVGGSFAGRLWFSREIKLKGSSRHHAVHEEVAVGLLLQHLARTETVDFQVNENLFLQYIPVSIHNEQVSLSNIQYRIQSQCQTKALRYPIYNTRTNTSPI
jgi:hypothetical protein